MKLSFLNQLSLRIILLFTIMMIVSFIPDYLRSFFGDEYCSGYVFNKVSNKLEQFIHYGSIHSCYEWHWGYRHWLFFLMGFCLFIIQIIDIIHFIKTFKEN